MYFITKKDSDTGKKFEAVRIKMNECLKVQKELSKQIGFESWGIGYWLVAGGFSSVRFNKDVIVDTKIWKQCNGGYLPKLNSKEGKRIEALLMTCPTVTIDELNQCVGFDGAPFKTIGFAGNNDSPFGFVVRDDWGFIKPDDCEEVTNSKYNELFKP